MSERELFLVVPLAVVIIGGIIATAVWRRWADERLIKERLAQIFERQTSSLHTEHVLIEQDQNDKSATQQAAFGWLEHILQMSDSRETTAGFINTSLAIILLGLVITLALDISLLFGILGGVGIVVARLMILYSIGQRKRMKFIEQLPGSLDLMVSVLRSGLSVPQALKAVGDEMPAPCGLEFQQVLQRVNLGQSLSEAFAPTVQKFDLFELDLVRRAAAIQLEVGGSLAELLDKTNATLRQRLKLFRQVRVLTAQSRLSGTIIALLPIFVAIAFNAMNPGYLTPLFDTGIGRMMLMVAIAFQVAGIIVIRKMSTIKV